MSLTSDNLLYTQDGLVSSRFLYVNNFYQLISKQSFVSPTNDNVYCLETIKEEVVPDSPKAQKYYYFNPMKEYIFENDWTKGIKKIGYLDPDPNAVHATKKLSTKDLDNNYTIYKITAVLNRTGALSVIPGLNTVFAYTPGSSLVTDALRTTETIGSAVKQTAIGKGGTYKRKPKTKKNKRKSKRIRKTKRKTKK